MKTLLLGASGQLGKEWQYFFAESSRDWVVIPYTSSQLDITRFKEVQHEIKDQQPDLIINCAAFTKVDEAEKKREEAMKVNTEAVQNLANLCDQYDIKLVHFSTDYIFAGRKEDRERFPNGYPEDHPPDPINWYGHTKWEGEQAIRASGCSHLIMRVSWLCGAYGGNFVKTMLRMSDQYEQIDVVDDQFGSPTFTGNLVENTLHLIESGREGTYHLTSQGLISWADFAESIFEMADKKVDINRIPSEAFPTTAARPFFSKLSTAKMKRVEGAILESWQKGLRRLLTKINQT